MILRKTPKEIEMIAAAGSVVSRCLTMLRGKARPGVTTLELEGGRALHPLAGR